VTGRNVLEVVAELVFEIAEGDVGGGGQQAPARVLSVAGVDVIAVRIGESSEGS